MTDFFHTIFTGTGGIDRRLDGAIIRRHQESIGGEGLDTDIGVGEQRGDVIPFTAVRAHITLAVFGRCFFGIVLDRHLHHKGVYVVRCSDFLSTTKNVWSGEREREREIPEGD